VVHQAVLQSAFDTIEARFLGSNLPISKTK
jgi:hypothetical protein